MKTMLLITILAMFSICAWTQTEIPAKRVAVMNLKVSGDYSEQLRDWLPALIEERLLKEGWTLVVRGDRMEHIQKERKLEGLDPSTKLPEATLVGATAFIEMNARVQVKDIQGLIGYKYFTFGDYARASVDLNGQIVDPATGLLKSSLTVGGSASGLKTSLIITIGSDWKIGAGGYNIAGIKQSLVGKAADQAAEKLVGKLKMMYCDLPMQAEQIWKIYIALPDDNAQAGDRYGVFDGENMVAEVELVRINGRRAEARIISQSKAIQPEFKARPLAIEIQAEKQ